MKIKKDPLIIGLIIIIIAFALYQIFVSPQRKCLQALSKQYNSQEKLLSERKAKLQAMDLLKETNNKLKEDLSSLDAKFLKRDDITSSLKDISALIKNTGNEVIIIDPIEQEEEIKEGIIKYTVKIKLKGMYVDIMKFLDKIQTGDKLAIIDKGELLVAQEGAPLLEAHFTITCFVIEI